MNEDLVRRTRELVGPEGRIMLDCYMALTVPYTIELVRRRIRDSVDVIGHPFFCL